MAYWHARIRASNICMVNDRLDWQWTCTGIGGTELWEIYYYDVCTMRFMCCLCWLLQCKVQATYSNLWWALLSSSVSNGSKNESCSPGFDMFTHWVWTRNHANIRHRDSWCAKPIRIHVNPWGLTGLARPLAPNRQFSFSGFLSMVSFRYSIIMCKIFTLAHHWLFLFYWLPL
jgi:hypothetical protein